MTAFCLLARRKREALLVAALTPVALRLALFPAVGIPAPKVADEFGYLLVADTFASGRIVNPTHPLWQHFETLYVLQEPFRASIYPIASGIVMALPKSLGLDPWFGVLASVGLMCAALCWMLQSWVQPHWALLGALLAAFHVGIDSYWVNSYWGGAVAATGGALVLGALARLRKRATVLSAVLMVAGFAILVQSRPFEGSLLFLTVAAALATYYLRQGPVWRRWFARSSAPALVTAGCAVFAATLFYNWRVTANPLVPPYLLHQKIYGTPQNFRFGTEVVDAPRASVHPDIKENFEWQRETFRAQITWRGLVDGLWAKLKSLWSFFLGPALTVPLLVFGLWERRVRFLAVALLFVVVGAGVLYPFFFPHYVAPAYAALLCVVVRGLIRIRRLHFSRGPVGRVWVRWILASTLLSTASGTLGWTALASALSLEPTPRSLIEDKLSKIGGSHLVLVRYSSVHDFHKSWIYNAADIDKAPIVWARDLGKEGNQPIIEYYRNREVWLAETDEDPPLLTPYVDLDRPRITAVQNAAGKSVYYKEGVAPGAIVTITGWNLARGLTSDLLASGFAAGEPRTLLATAALVRHPQLPQPVDLPGVTVRFNGKPAPILAALRDGEQQTLAVLAPAELPGRTVDLEVRVGDNAKSVRLPVLPADPGIFQMVSAEGVLSGAVIHADGTPVSPRAPARRRETLHLLVTGLGRDPVRGVVVGVNHRGADYRRTQRSTPLPGLDVITFQVPPEAPSGPNIPLSMAVDGAGARVYGNASTIAIE